MADSEFVAGLRAKRAGLARDLSSATAKLPAAIAAADAATAKHREMAEARSRVGDHRISQADQEASNVAAAAANVVASLTREKEKAQALTADADRLLSAADDASRERRALAEADARVRDLQDRRAQLEQIEAALQDELAGLAETRGNALAQHGEAELAARLVGKSASAPRTLATLDADTEARHAALTAAQAAKAELGTTLETAIADADVIRRRLRDALTRSAELAFFEALPAFLPILARVAASGSAIGASGGAGTFVIDLDAEMLDAAAAELEAELNIKPDRSTEP